MADRIIALPRQQSVAASIEDPGQVAAVTTRGRSPNRPASGGGKKGGGNKSRNRGQGGRGNRAPTPGGKKGYCRYHAKWGVDAERCIPPCSYFPEEN
jgi:hypothetical protein